MHEMNFCVIWYQANAKQNRIYDIILTNLFLQILVLIILSIIFEIQIGHILHFSYIYAFIYVNYEV